MEKEKFYQRTWFTVLFLILFFPVGLFTMWKYKKFNKIARIVITVLLVFFCFVSYLGDDSDNTDSSSTEATTESTTKATTEATTKSTTEATTEATTKATTESTTEATTAKKKLTKKDYNPQITYNDLARTPDKYKYKRITFQGKVIQVIEDDENKQTQIRLATKDGYDNVILVAFNQSIIKTRVLEDDVIRFYGISVGLITYESTLGGDITIPAATAEKIKILN